MTQDEALTILKTGANVFLTGEPGSGKTHTINQYVSWLRERGVEPSITASTGIAATHIGGFTIHSWSGIGVKRTLSDYDLDQLAQNKRVVERVMGAHVLIIDEVSMLSATTLSMVDAVCRTVRRSERAFGGLQVILVGDFFQLPPVVRPDVEDESQELFDDERRSPFSFASPSWSRLKLIVCYLHEQHRQEDAAYLDVLTAMRQSTLLPSHRALLKSRFVPAKSGVTELYSHNADVDQINNVAINALEGQVRIFTMTSVGNERLVDGLKRGCLSPELLPLKVGARVMFTKNDVQTHHYANGTLGVVHSFSPDNGKPIVKTRNGRMLLVEEEDWSISDNGRVLASITQLPLRLAWAMTVHKSQGMSLDAAHMDLSHAFEYGQGYVALSRVRTLEGLSLGGLNERALEVHPEILEVDATFREESESAREAFAKMSPQELVAMHANFIRASGGHEPRESRQGGTRGGPHESGAGGEGNVGVKSKLDLIREKHPNAYRPWTSEQDTDLTTRFEDGEKMKDIAKAFGRQQGSIRARLLKLGLIEETE